MSLSAIYCYQFFNVTRTNVYKHFFNLFVAILFHIYKFLHILEYFLLCIYKYKQNTHLLMVAVHSTSFIIYLTFSVFNRSLINNEYRSIYQLVMHISDSITVLTHNVKIDMMYIFIEITLAHNIVTVDTLGNKTAGLNLHFDYGSHSLFCIRDSICRTCPNASCMNSRTL